METVLIVIHLMVVLALVGVVLLQRSEGGGLGIGGGSGFMTARGAANALTRATGILAVAFFATSLTLSIIARYGEQPIDILDRVPAARPGRRRRRARPARRLRHRRRRRRRPTPPSGDAAARRRLAAAPAAPPAPIRQPRRRPPTAPRPPNLQSEPVIGDLPCAADLLSIWTQSRQMLRDRADSSRCAAWLCLRRLGINRL